MYCNSCVKQIPKDEITYCAQCSAPLHKSCANHCMTCGKELCDTCYGENNFRCEECYKPENMFSVIRRSHIEQYNGCPYSLYLQLVKGITPPMGKHAQLGVIVHELIDQTSKTDTTLSNTQKELLESIEQWNLSTEDEYSIIDMELEQTGKTCLDNFWKIKDTFNKDSKSECNIKYSVDDDLPTISCTLDRVVFNGKDIHVHDWKTGRPMSGQKLITDLQPPLYMYGVYKEFGVMPKTFTLHYLQSDKHIVYEQVSDMVYEVKTSRNTYTLDVEKALTRTKEILTGIKQQKFNMPTKGTHEWYCKNMCWFYKSGDCANSQSEQWKVLNKEYKKAV